MDFIFAFRFQLHRLKILQGVYLSLATILSVFTILLWSQLNLKYNISLGGLILPIAFIHGFLAWLFIDTKQKTRIIIYIGVFSILTILLNKYIFYFHFFHWSSAFYIDKSQIGTDLIITYVRYMDAEMLKFFFREWLHRFSFLDIIWVGSIFLFAFQYKIWDRLNEKYLSRRREKTDVKHHVIKRRFG